MEHVEKRVLLQMDTYEKVNKAYNNYKKSPKERITVGYVQGRMEALDTYWKEFKVAHEKIILSISVEERPLLPYFADSMFDDFEELYYSYIGELKTALMKFSSEIEKMNAPRQNVSNPSTSSSEIRLPRISIPTFSGNYTEWQSFHDLFVALIHNNSSIENVQKLHYLKSSLTGDAEVLLRQFSITGDNYTEAWSILKKRYNNKRYIASNIFKKFFGQRALSQESAAGIKQLLDTTVECMNALKNLGLPTEKWDAIVMFIVVSKLDVNSHRQWEEAISGDGSDEIPGFERLKLFLETRFRTLEMVEPASKSYKQPQSVKPKTFHVTASNDVLRCTFCNENHYIYNCKQFAKLPMEERYSFVQGNNLCFNCLIPNHTVFKCRQQTRCQICKRKHHSLLHRENKQLSEEKQDTTATIEEQHKQLNEEETLIKVTGHVTSGEQPGQDILLATALVDVTSSSGQSHVFRALIDQGSEASFVTASVVELLGLKKTQISGVVSGVGEGNQMSLKHSVDLQIKSRYDTNYTLNVIAYVLKSLTRRLPAREIRGYIWPQLQDIKLADPTFKVPGSIDILLGADVFGRIIDTGLMRGPGNVVAQHSHLGWILSGNIDVASNRSRNVTSLHITRQIEEDKNLLSKFCELETEPYTTKKAWSKYEEKCEENYKNTTTRDTAGRYEVNLPLKQNMEETLKLCKDTKQEAISKKCEGNKKLKGEYTRVINEYLQLGHMEKAEKEDESVATYLTLTLLQLTDEESEKYPHGAAVVNDCFYMDDLQTGHEDLSEMKGICNEVNMLFKACKQGGFYMQKWSSNSEELLKFLQDGREGKERVDNLEIKLDKVIKTLGLTSQRNNDTFKISVNLPELRYPVTKRIVLAQCRRFRKSKNKSNREDYLTIPEINVIEVRCIRYYKYILVYESKIKDLKRHGKVRARISLINLTPYLNDLGLLRVGRRLTDTHMSKDAKQPFIIPGKQHITRPLINEAHIKTLHGDIMAMMTYTIEKTKIQQQLMGQFSLWCSCQYFLKG